MLNLIHLDTFLAVVRYGSIGKAAEALNLTQPAVTTRIKNLEHSVAAPLFERGAQGLKPTKRGEMLLTYAERFVHLSELVERDVVDLLGSERRLRLGISETIAQSWLPEFIKSLHQNFPKLSVEINIDISTSLRQSLLNRDIDLAILLGPVSEFSVENISLPAFELAWYVAKDISEEEAMKFNMPIASYSRNTRPYRELKSILHEKYGADFVIYPSSSLSACFRFVETGLCVAALPKVIAQKYIKNNLIKEFNPGWVPNALHFTASYLADPISHVSQTAAKIALQTSEKYKS